MYDALGRYHQDKKSSRALDYITFNALGSAILRTREREIAQQYLTPEQVPDQPCRSVVLIDEIDKAPRDFPNDVLSELEGMYFRIPEYGNVVIRARSDRPPILIITSNSEKHLPDAFLRRCTYYHIPFPEKERLASIVPARLGEDLDLGNEFLADSLDLLYEMRKPTSQVRKRPATAEFLGWLVALRRMAPNGANPLRSLGPNRIISTISTLVKTPEDWESGTIVVKKWLKRKRDAADAGADG